MTKRLKTRPSWSDVKSRLESFDRASLVGLIKSLYTASNENRSFLHARFAVSGDGLEPYKKTIERALSPNVLGQGKVSPSTALKAVSDYRKAAGSSAGLAELMVFYCEVAVNFCDQYGVDEGDFYPLLRMFEQGIQMAKTLSADQRDGFVLRLKEVCKTGQNLGYGIGHEMDALLLQYCDETLEDAG